VFWSLVVLCGTGIKLAKHEEMEFNDILLLLEHTQRHL
jgi:hypothetical protein